MYMRAIATLQLDHGVVTTTGAGTELDLQKYFVNPGKREMKAVLGALETVTSDSGTLAYEHMAARKVGCHAADLGNLGPWALSGLQDVGALSFRGTGGTTLPHPNTADALLPPVVARNMNFRTPGDMKILMPS